jgi:hypothetical protein
LEYSQFDALTASYDENAAILEDEEKAEESVAAAEAAIEAIGRECSGLYEWHIATRQFSGNAWPPLAINVPEGASKAWDERKRYV